MLSDAIRRRRSNVVASPPGPQPPTGASSEVIVDADFLRTLLEIEHTISDGLPEGGATPDTSVVNMSFEELLHAPILWMSDGNPIPPQPFASVLGAEDYMLLDQYFGTEEGVARHL